MTLKNNRAPLRSNIKLCASFNRHMWIQTGVTVWKRLNGVITSVTLTFDLDPLHGLPMVITPENFRMIQWQEHCQKCVTDGQTEGQMERSVLRAAWSQVKIKAPHKHQNYTECIYTKPTTDTRKKLMSAQQRSSRQVQDLASAQYPAVK